MCGRYYVDEDAAREVLEIVRDLDHSRKEQLPSGDIHPSERAAVICGGPGGLTAELMRWGFPRSGSLPGAAARESRGTALQEKKGKPVAGGSLLINARSETVREKPTFRESVLHSRCIIPAASFYEWDASGQKARLRRPGAAALFMAGIFRRYSEEERFVILTTAASGTAARVHDRMPLLLEPEELMLWTEPDGSWEQLLHARERELLCERDYEQLSLPL